MENNRISTSPQAIAAIKEGLSTIYLPPPLDASELRAAIAKKYGLSPEHVAVGNGSTELINILAQQRMTGSQLLISAPTFSLYPALGKLYNYTIEAIPLRNYAHDTHHIIKAITPETGILFLDSPHYITGTSLTKDEIEARCMAYRGLDKLKISYIQTESSILLVHTGLLSVKIEEMCSKNGIKVRGERKCALSGHIQTHLIDPITIAPFLQIMTEAVKDNEEHA